MDLDTLKKFSRGELSTRQFLAVHTEATELLDLLHRYLRPGEYVVTLADWPAVKARPLSRQFLTLKTMMLLTPLVLIGGLIFAFEYPLATLLSGLVWLGLFGVFAAFLLARRARRHKSRDGRSVVVVTEKRLMRIWLDGTEEVQSWMLSDDPSDTEAIEPVPETVQLLLHLDLGKTSLN